MRPTITHGDYPRLPSFACIGFFKCFQSRDPEMHASALVIIWFQEQSPVTGIDLPIENIDWWQHAQEFCY
jgi:hypothetical protein